jgi:hypothetical protein
MGISCGRPIKCERCRLKEHRWVIKQLNYVTSFLLFYFFNGREVVNKKEDKRLTRATRCCFFALTRWFGNNYRWFSSFERYLGVFMLVFGFVSLIIGLVFCAWMCREGSPDAPLPPNSELYWTHHW